VAALLAVYERGEIRIVKQVTLTIPLEPGLPVTLPAEPGDPVTVETTRS
jgi:hypothetical protein